MLPIAFGYYDQMHMVHDFAEFTGATPSETLNQLETVFVEQIKSLRTDGPAGSGGRPLKTYPLTDKILQSKHAPFEIDRMGRWGARFPD